METQQYNNLDILTEMLGEAFQSIPPVTSSTSLALSIMYPCSGVFDPSSAFGLWHIYMFLTPRSYETSLFTHTPFWLPPYDYTFSVKLSEEVVYTNPPQNLRSAELR